MIWKGFCGPSYVSQSPLADQEECINLYVEKSESQNASTPFSLYPTPGMTLLHQTLSSQGRAHMAVNGREFIVCGALLFELDIDGAATFRSFVEVDGNPATISSNGDGGDEIFITSGGNGYVMNLTTNVVTQITALNGKATMGDQLDGYFLALDANTGTFYSSELLDGLTWTTGTMFAQRNAAPDAWLAMKVNGPYIHLFGSQTSEVWYDAGAVPFPFAKHPSGLIPYGISAPFSLRVCDQSLMWLGSTKGGRGQTYRMTGFSPETVSTYAVQFAVSGYSEISDCYGDYYTEAGHSFYIQQFPTANVTWVYDLQMQMWHKRGTWDQGTASGFSLWRPRCHAFAFGEHRWLDYAGGGVFRMGLDSSTDPGGFAIRRVRQSPAMVSENERISYPSIAVDLETGLGLTSGQGSDPQVMLSLSRDGGKTFGSERMRSAGKTGEYGKRLIWNRNGMAQRLVARLVMTDPVPWRILNAYLSGPEVLPVRRSA